MDLHLQIDHQPTDMMHRRTLLPFNRRFLWFGIAITICTDSPAVLNAAEAAGLVMQRSFGQERELRWDIVAEQDGEATTEPWESKLTRDSNSLYMSMGSQQWFAFDLAMGDGVGFVTISDPDRPRDVNAELYLRTVLENVRVALQPELEMRR